MRIIICGCASSQGGTASGGCPASEGCARSQAFAASQGCTISRDSQAGARAVDGSCCNCRVSCPCLRPAQAQETDYSMLCRPLDALLTPQSSADPSRLSRTALLPPGIGELDHCWLWSALVPLPATYKPTRSLRRLSGTACPAAHHGCCPARTARAWSRPAPGAQPRRNWVRVGMASTQRLPNSTTRSPNTERQLSLAQQAQPHPAAGAQLVHH